MISVFEMRVTIIYYFTFELESDLEKVLLGEPWSIDRHLVVLQRYDGILPMEKVEFSKSLF